MRFIEKLYKEIPQKPFNKRVTLTKLMGMSVEKGTDRFTLMIEIMSYLTSIGFKKFNFIVHPIVDNKIRFEIQKAFTYIHNDMLVANILGTLAHSMFTEFEKFKSGFNLDKISKGANRYEEVIEMKLPHHMIYPLTIGGVTIKDREDVRNISIDTLCDLLFFIGCEIEFVEFYSKNGITDMKSYWALVNVIEGYNKGEDIKTIENYIKMIEVKNKQEEKLSKKSKKGIQQIQEIINDEVEVIDDEILEQPIPNEDLSEEQTV